MIAEKVLEPTRTKWAALFVFTPKKDESLQICVDYKKLDAVTVRGPYPLPLIHECIDSLRDSMIFSKRSKNSSYSEIEVEYLDSDETALISLHGHFRFTIVKSGLRNASAAFR